MQTNLSNYKKTKTSLNEKSHSPKAKSFSLVQLLNLVRLYQNNTTNLKILLVKKSLSFRKASPNLSGLDGTRTRDPMRDRHVF